MANNMLSSLKNVWLLPMAIVMLGFTACTHHEAERAEPFNYVVTSAYQRDTLLQRDYVAQLNAFQHIEIRALERGYLQKIFVDEGQKIADGQTMFQIQPVLYQAEKQKAEAERQFAEIEYLNTKRLADSNIVAPTELSLSGAKLQRAHAELSLAKAHLKFTEIKAPFHGIMDRFYVRLGSLVNEGDLLTKLSDNSRMWAYFNVPEAEYLDLKTKTPNDSLIKVKLVMANQKLFDQTGVVETIEADFNNETGNIAFRAAFQNPKGLLRHGETGNVRMTLPYEKALMIPQKATFEILEKRYVFVVDDKNIVHQREVTVAAEMPDLYIIKEGLKATDKILLEGLQKVKDKDKITFKYLSPQQVLPTLKVYTE